MNLSLRIQHELGKWDTQQFDFYSSLDDSRGSRNAAEGNNRTPVNNRMTGPWLLKMEVSPSRKSVWAPVLSSSRNLDLLFRYNSLTLSELLLGSYIETLL